MGFCVEMTGVCSCQSTKFIATSARESEAWTIQCRSLGKAWQTQTPFQMLMLVPGPSNGCSSSSSSRCFCSADPRTRVCTKNEKSPVSIREVRRPLGPDRQKLNAAREARSSSGVGDIQRVPRAACLFENTSTRWLSLCATLAFSWILGFNKHDKHDSRVNAFVLGPNPCAKVLLPTVHHCMPSSESDTLHYATTGS